MVSLSKKAEWCWPRGEMCMSCTKLRDNCSHLPFNEMKVIGRDPEGFEVKCTSFDRKEND